MPESATFSGQYWRVELLFSILLLGLLSWTYYKNKPNLSLSEISDSNFRNLIITWLLFIVWSGLSIFWTDSLIVTAHHTLSWAIYLVFLFYLLKLIKIERNIDFPVRTFIFTSLILGGICLFDYLTLEDFKAQEGNLRIRYAKFAELLLTFAPLLWILGVYPKNKIKSIGILTIGAIAWGVVMFSLSKGAFISSILGFILCFAGSLAFAKKGFRRKLIYVGGFWIIFTVSTQFLVSKVTTIPTTIDYISGTADEKRESSNFRIFAWKITKQMIEDNPLTGVGANNFGIEVNQSRINYATINPNDPQNEISEEYLVERSHNEFLQVFAELGVIGMLSFLALMITFGWWSFKQLKLNKWQMSLTFWGSFSGCLAFLLSSLFSSFSFRLLQNGIVFIMVFSLVVNELLKITKKNKQVNKDAFYSKNYKIIFTASIFVVILMFTLSTSRTVSNYYTYLAERTSDAATAEDYFQKAIITNPENGSTYLSYGDFLFLKDRHKESAINFLKAIDLGMGTTLTYSYLADAYLQDNQIIKAKETMHEAVKIYPLSSFARVRYALLLEKNGEISESKEQLEIARNFNKKQTNGWYLIIKQGSLAAFTESQKSNEITPPAELLPNNAIYKYLDKPTSLNLLVAKD